MDKIIIERHPSKIDKDGKRHYTIRAIPHQDPQQERLKAVHEAGSRSSPGSEQQVNHRRQPEVSPAPWKWPGMIMARRFLGVRSASNPDLNQLT